VPGPRARVRVADLDELPARVVSCEVLHRRFIGQIVDQSLPHGAPAQESAGSRIVRAFDVLDELIRLNARAEDDPRGRGRSVYFATGGLDLLHREENRSRGEASILKSVRMLQVGRKLHLEKINAVLRVAVGPHAVQNERGLLPKVLWRRGR